MEQRILGRTGLPVSVIGLGTWQLGADWGHVDEQQALEVLHTAYGEGVRFFDTADVYGDGRSERIIAEFLHANGISDVVVATKVGRRAEQIPENYILENLREWVDRSRKNLRTETLDLVQLHCPPPGVYSSNAVFDAMDTLVEEGRVAHYGVSVERRIEALAAMARPGVGSIQIILNMLRQAPILDVLPAAQAANVGIIARVPLASGLLSGKFTEDTVFPEDDHRNYNRTGAAFDVGETFSGVDYKTGLEAARRIEEVLPPGTPLTDAALRWIIDLPGVSTVIPGARRSAHASANSAVAGREPLEPVVTQKVADIYRELIAPQIGDRW